MSELNTFFKKLGLTDEETAVYLFLLQNGISTILELAGGVRINRTNLYRICEKLSREGYVKRIAGRNTTKFEAVSVDFLRYKIYEKKRKAIELKSQYEEMKQSLGKFSKVSELKIKVIHYSGKEEVKQLMWNYLETRGECLSFGFRTLSEAVGREFVIKWWNEAKRRGIYDKMLANKGTFEMKNAVDIGARKKLEYGLYENLEERTIDERVFRIYYETFIYNDVFAIVQWEGNFVFGLEVYSKELSDFKRREFYHLWELAKPAKRIDEKT
ncbi:MAG: helix-turn-helix domain-containing protein [Candidatus Dojkabacteria bacterium]|nr:helix-turn-helix domain-containing protein [Candidatus Dojkabacteria bacterium]